MKTLVNLLPTGLALKTFVEACKAHSKHMRQNYTFFCNCTPNFSGNGIHGTENEVPNPTKKVSAKKLSAGLEPATRRRKNKTVNQREQSTKTRKKERKN